MKSYIPNTLGENSEIRIISTARAISKDEIEPAFNLLKSWGFKVSFGANLFQKNHQFAGNRKERTQDLQDAVNDDNVSAVLFARGGYGTVQIIDGVDFQRLITKPKWFVGYSDVTVVHSHLHANSKIASIHATMPINFNNNSESFLNFIEKLPSRKAE